MFFEDQNEFIVEFQDAVSRIGIGSHLHTAARCVRRCDFLPDDSTHVVEADVLAKPDDLLADGNDLVSSVVNGARKLITNVDTQPAAVVNNAVTFFPDEVEVVDVILVAVVKADLIVGAIVFQLPVRRRGDGQVHRVIPEFRHLPAVTVDYGMMRFQNSYRVLQDKVNQKQRASKGGCGGIWFFELS